MKKTIIIAMLLCMGVIGIVSAKGRELTFGSDGCFKILQLTDLHIVKDSPKSEVCYENVKKVVGAEHPDLIVVTGDMIYSRPADEAFNHVMTFLSGFGVPYIITFGNHDHQFGKENSELMKIAERYPLCQTTSAKGVTGTGNCDIAIEGKDGKAAWVLYCFDSGDMSHLKEAGVDGYDYIHGDQVSWYEKRSASREKANGGKKVRGLAFFHIPLPEYEYAIEDESTTKVGHKGEKPCVPKINSGLFAAMKERGDVRGVFCGHDHDNDYAVNYYGILLAYGRYSGADTEYNNLKPNGARVIELKESSGDVTTWVITRDGKRSAKATFPQDFEKQAEK